MPTVRLVNGHVMVRFAAEGPGQLNFKESTMNCTLYQRELEKNVKVTASPSVGEGSSLVRGEACIGAENFSKVANRNGAPSTCRFVAGIAAEKREVSAVIRELEQ